MERKTIHPKDYIIHDGLRYAVEGALSLGQPLLLTGEPGTGKTLLAYWAAWHLSQQQPDFHPEPLKFNTKTNSSARDLFYSYDALSHFQAANLREGEPKKTADFIELQALGLAIANTNPAALDFTKFRRMKELSERPIHSVVLIDEVDKAPRDFSNDLLDEIENFRFRIKEQDNYELKRAGNRDILVILTSNSEKNLPDAFLRRCAFYHIPFPDQNTLREIVLRQVEGANSWTEQALNDILDRFQKIRQASVRKKPATAELVGWLRLLSLHHYFEGGKSDAERRALELNNLSFLVKTQEDLAVIRNLLHTL